MPNHKLNNSDGHLTQTSSQGNAWDCGHCFVPNLANAEVCRNCRKQKMTIDEANYRNNRNGHLCYHYFLGFIELIALATLIKTSATALSSVVTLIIVWWSGLIFMIINPSPENWFTYTQKIAEDFISQQIAERQKLISIIYRFLYWPIFFQKAIVIWFGILAIVWLFYSLK